MEYKYKLQGFNNLTKTLSISFYNIYYIPDNNTGLFQSYIFDKYNSEKLSYLLSDITKLIDANILNIAKQDYDPHGASVNLLISEGINPVVHIDRSCNQGVISPCHMVGHLDKSHITVHTYPDIHLSSGIATIRIDIDISTCGEISSLKAINYLIQELNSDIMIIDYRIRGYTRDINGNKIFSDHRIDCIEQYIHDSLISLYNIHTTRNDKEINSYYLKLYRNRISVHSHIIPNKESFSNKENQLITQLISKEIKDILN